VYDCARHSLESNKIEGGKTKMISKEQFLTIKRLKQEGVPIAAITRIPVLQMDINIGRQQAHYFYAFLPQFCSV